MVPDPLDRWDPLRVACLYCLSRSNNTDVRDVVKDQYEDRWRRNLEQLTDLLKEYFRAGDYEVPQVLHGAARVATQRLPSVLFEVFRSACHQGPKEFFDQYKLNQARLRASVDKVGGHLSGNTLYAPKAFENDPVAHKVVDLHLRTKRRIANADLRLKEPLEGSPLHPGWSALDNYFRAGGGGGTSTMCALACVAPTGATRGSGASGRTS